METVQRIINVIEISVLSDNVKKEMIAQKDMTALMGDVKSQNAKRTKIAKLKDLNASVVNVKEIAKQIRIVLRTSNVKMENVV